ncbi:hypothetical protein [Novilysobacter erysipheiresistens]|uniref:Uncharacterized protein n=1 Tax=Novilysobacter erysipheiresistens TaxID=1749332 RepID=A0ABU7YUW3_9GAMM
MYVTDPDETPTDTATPDPATAAAEAATPDEPEDMAAGMDRAFAEATPDLMPGTNEAADAEREAAEAAAAEAAKPADGEPDPAKADKAKPDDGAEAAAEADSLGLKGKANERFREMAAEIKTLAPIKEQLEKAGITDIAQLPQMVQSAKNGEDMVEMVSSTGASPEQFGQTLDYLSLISKANSGDRKAAEQAFELIQGEVTALAKALGREVPGLFDPLAEHPDLAEQIEAGDLTRKAALEVVGARNHQNALQRQRQQADQQTQAQRQQEQVVNQARSQLVQWDAAMAAKDPTYPAKRAALNAEVAKIRQQFPPAQWVAATELAYRSIPNPQPAPAATTTPAAGNPVRPGGPRGTLAPEKFDSMDDAMQWGFDHPEAAVG